MYVSRLSIASDIWGQFPPPNPSKMGGEPYFSGTNFHVKKVKKIFLLASLATLASLAESLPYFDASYYYAQPIHASQKRYLTLDTCYTTYRERRRRERRKFGDFEATEAKNAQNITLYILIDTQNLRAKKRFPPPFSCKMGGGIFPPDPQKWGEISNVSPPVSPEMGGKESLVIHNFTLQKYGLS